MAIADSSVLIPLARAGRLGLLRKCYKNVVIAGGMEKELIEENKPGAHELKIALGEWIKIEKITKKLQNGAEELSGAENISKIDAEIILLALRKKDEIISNDYRIHAVSKTKGVKSKWITTFILECVEKKILSKDEAKNLLLELVKFGVYINVEIYALILKKIDEI